MHPTGERKRVLLIGGSGSSIPLDPQDSEGADAVLLAPTPKQCRELGSIKALVRHAVQMTAPDGMIYVLAPRRSRAAFLRLLRRYGFDSATPIIHFASGAARYFVPLDAAPLRHAIQTWPLSSRWRQIHRLLHVAPSISRVLAMVLPQIGFATARRDSRPFGWFLSRLPGGCGKNATFATSWRGPEAPALLFGFSAGASLPSLVGKRDPASPRGPSQREASRLENLGPGAREAGMLVPEPLEDEDMGWLFQTAVAGRPASRILAARPSELASLLEEVAEYLGRWHRLTLQRVELTLDRLEQEILGPAKLLGDVMEDGQNYVGWLTTAAEKLAGQRVPLVTTHGDLTMANVLRQPDGATGLVDWEAARPLSLPLADFWYAACDAVAAIDEYRNRPVAFHDCFVGNGRYGELIASCERSLRTIVDGPAAWIDICFHGCWLHHAANEHVRAEAAGCRPFLAIANALSRPGFRGNRFA